MIGVAAGVRSPPVRLLQDRVGARAPLYELKALAYLELCPRGSAESPGAILRAGEREGWPLGFSFGSTRVFSAVHTVFDAHVP